MRFSKLIVKNFRSIGPEGVEVFFSSERNFAAILGANGSGKSNVLNAIAIALGVFPFQRLDISEQDFYCKDTEKELFIELHLASPIKDRDVYQQQYEIFGFRYRAWRKMRGDGKGVLTHEHCCFAKNGETLVKPQRIYKKSKDDKEAMDNTKLPVQAQDHAWKIATAFYLDAPSLERFFDKTTGWGPLGRLFDIYRDDFSANHNEVSLENGNKVVARKAFEDLSKRLAEILKTAKLKDIEKGLSARIREYLGSDSSEPLQIEFALPSSRELFERGIALQLSECKDQPSLSVSGLGSGYRALFRLAVIETLIDMQEGERKFLLLIEEPEIYLHVHLRRYFSKILRRVAERGNQVIFTTHSSEFVDLERPHEIVRLQKPSGGPTIVRQVAQKSTFDFARAKQKLRRLGNQELFFSRYAILTEGQDDQGIIEFLLQAKGVDIDVYSISIINCDSVDNIPDYVRLCIELGIDFYVIHDQDDATRDKKRNDRIYTAVQASNPACPSLHMYVPYLEAVMGQTKHCGMGYLLSLLNGKGYEQITKDYPELIIPMERFVQTRGLKPFVSQMEKVRT